VPTRDKSVDIPGFNPLDAIA